MKYFCFLLIALAIISCKQRVEQSLKIIKINPAITDSIKLSEISSDVERIILETNDSCLMTGIQDIKRTARYIFVNDGAKRVLKFDKSGKFIKQIGDPGRGPGEYMSIYSIAIDSLNNLLYIASIPKIMCFNFEGKFVHEFKPQHFAEYITVIGDTLWTVSTSVGNKIGDNSYMNITKLVRYTLQGNFLDSIIVKKVHVPGPMGTLNPQAYYVSDLRNVQYLYYPVLIQETLLRDTLYQIAGSKIKASLKLDFGKAGEPQDGKKSVFIYNIYTTTNYLFSEYYFINKKNFYFYNRLKKNGVNVSEGIIDDYYNTGIIQLKPLELKNETLYFVKDAFYLGNKIEGVNENSNPVIFIVKLRAR